MYTFAAAFIIKYLYKKEKRGEKKENSKNKRNKKKKMKLLCIRERMKERFI
jgi:hypothetical protein